MDRPQIPTPREHLEQLQPPAPVLNVPTLGSGLGDAAARESVARLLARVPKAEPGRATVRPPCGTTRIAHGPALALT